jgi:hypothetical protein
MKTGLVKKDDDGKELSISVARVLDATDTNELDSPMESVLGVILVKDLETKYPDAGYVDKIFEIRKTPIKGKRAKAYQVWEMESES